MVQDARQRTKVYLDTYLTAANITKDDGSSLASFAVIFANKYYPLLEEFYASSSPVDVLFCIGEPNSTALTDTDQAPYGYEEHVPIEIVCVDKLGVTGTKMKWTAEAELRRVCETNPLANPLGSQRFLQRIGPNDQDMGSTVLYGVRFVLNYVRDLT